MQEVPIPISPLIIFLWQRARVLTLPGPVLSNNPGNRDLRYRKIGLHPPTGCEQLGLLLQNDAITLIGKLPTPSLFLFLGIVVLGPGGLLLSRRFSGI